MSFSITVFGYNDFFAIKNALATELAWRFFAFLVELFDFTSKNWLLLLRYLRLLYFLAHLSLHQTTDS